MQFLKCRPKDFIKLSLIAATASILTPAFAQTAAPSQAPVAVSAEAAVPANLYAAVKFPPLLKFSENLMAVARKVEPGPNTEMLPMFLLGGFGYPSFTGVSTTEGVTLFALKGEDEAQPLALVVLAKVEAGSQTLTALTHPPLNLKVQQREGWTLLAQDQSAFAAVKDLQALVRVAQSPSDFAVEVRGYGSKATFTSLQTLIDEIAAEQQEADAAKVKAWGQLVFRMLEHYTSVGYGLSFDADRVEIGVTANAVVGSPVAKFISAALPAGKVAAGETLAMDGSLFSLVGRLNVSATKEYLAWVNTLVADIPEEKARKLVADVLGLYDKFLAQWDGNYASSLVEFNLENSQSNSLSVISGAFTQEQLDEINTYTMETVLPEFFGLIESLTGADNILESFKATVKPNAETIDGKNVTTITVLTPDPEDETKPIAQNTYYTVAKGAMLSANKLDTLQSLVALYEAGQPVANNLSDALPLAEGNMARGLIDLQGLGKQLATFAAAEEGAEASDTLKQIVALIDQTKVDPAALLVDTKGTRAVYSLSLSVDSIVSIINTYKAIDALEAPAGETVEIEVQTTGGN